MTHPRLIDEFTKLSTINDDLYKKKQQKQNSSDPGLTLRMLVKHYRSSGSTLTLGALDISKAFDRVNFYGLINFLEVSLLLCITSYINVLVLSDGQTHFAHNHFRPLAVGCGSYGF